MSKLRLCILIAVACVAGVISSELLCRWDVFRDAAGRLFGRGGLVANTAGTGFYERDLDGQEVFSAFDFVAAENLRRLAQHEQTDAAGVDRELFLLRAQFGLEKTFVAALGSTGLSVSSLREKIMAQLRSLQWLEKQIAAATKATEEECREFYQAHREAFAQPARFRASHIFLAAPAETPPEVVESKQKAIDALALRLSRGESLPQLAAEASEDEATKALGGDLGFFSSARVSPEFFAAVEKLRASQTGKPFRSHLGFHIVQVTEIKAARLIGFTEARREIALAMANGRRALIAQRLAETLSGADYVAAD